MNFKKKTVLITGANQGIGYVILKNFFYRKAFVIGTSTTSKGVKAISSYLKKRGKGIQLNYLNRFSIDCFLNKIIRKFSKIDILIHNAGIVHDTLLSNMQESHWNSVIKVNLTSVFYLSRKIIPLMIKNRYGRIVSIGSVIGSTGNIGQTNYSASKSGIVGFSKSLAQELAPYGITVNVVSPGFVETNIVKKIKKKKKKFFLSRIPMNRFGTPQEIADAVLFLSSCKAGYITGETLNVNGGMYMK